MSEPKPAPAGFDPHHPTCQGCGTALKHWHILFTIVYDGTREPFDFRGRSHQYQCPKCSAYNGVVVPDDLKPGDGYLVSKEKKKKKLKSWRKKGN